MCVQQWGLLIVIAYGSSFATGKGSTCSEVYGSVADDANRFVENAVSPGPPDLAESQATTNSSPGVATRKSELEPTELLAAGWFDATLSSDYRGCVYIASAFGTSYVTNRKFVAAIAVGILLGDLISGVLRCSRTAVRLHKLPKKNINELIRELLSNSQRKFDDCFNEIRK